jgi:hypothetical protein
MDRTASGQKFVALPCARNGRSPIMWQIELIDQVMWCSTAIRTSPAQKNAVRAPQNDIVIRPPRTAGASRLTAVHSGNCRLIRAVAPEQPSEVGVAEAPGQGDGAGSEQPGRVGVTLLVGEGVVAAVVGGPGDHVALSGQAARNREGVAQRSVRLEGAVSEVAVEADGDSECADQVEGDSEADVHPAQTPAPGHRDGHRQRECGKDREDVDQRALAAGAHSVQHGLSRTKVPRGAGFGVDADRPAGGRSSQVRAP